LIEVINSNKIQVVCQTEMLLNGEFYDPEEMNKLCREKKIGFISTQIFGPLGYAFVDFGEKHVITDEDGEALKNFMVMMIEKGETTKLTIHDSQNHTIGEQDYVLLKEVEGMTELNGDTPY
jgi:hypothetical protein